MRVICKDELERQQGPRDRFDGEVWQSRLLRGRDQVNISLVRFEDGARTNWHEHQEEQILYIVEGECRVATASIPEVRLTAGDQVHLPPGERHWHGAVPGASMAHLSITTGADPTWYEPAP